METTNDSEKQIYGGFWKRTAAFVIDLIIVTVMALLVAGIFSMIPVLLDMEEVGFIKALHMLWPLILWLIVPWLYCVLWESSNAQATPGKLAFSLIVVNEEGKRLGFMHASGRYWIKAISGVFVHIIYIVVAFTAKKQGLHDLCAKTLVVNKKELQRHEQHPSLSPVSTNIMN
ncbi:RDD family protein [Paenibacillus sp. 23TSA30-6]|nr:RDD family protein [Paenibacillus sp. 23TSA30-6]MBE0338315.1 RDD family protein [Paenibacillus sp. 23TSA30-6]